MQRAKELGFDISERCNGYIKKHTPTGLRDFSKVNEGDEVILQKGDIQVQIQIIKNNFDQTYIGQVLSVNPYGALKNNNITEDREISFSYRHIFWVHHR